MDTQAQGSTQIHLGFKFDNSYRALPARFYSVEPATPVAKPTLIRLNRALAETLGGNAAALESEEGVAVLAGNAVAEGMAPIALAYAGHQFGNLVSQLGDGRALLLGEVKAPNRRRFDLQLKGSGPTHFSRGGDGRSPLGPVLREYIVSESMAALGVPTSRALAAVATGETVYRSEALPGAILARVASSHLRVGTFEFFACRRDVEALRTLLSYATERHYPELSAPSTFQFLQAVASRQAELIAKWMHFGFIHGVMNTDNTLISGETIDYGPCAFMDHFEKDKVFSSIDRWGRYAYANQAKIGAWNLVCLAQTLLPIAEVQEEDAIKRYQAIVDGYTKQFEECYWRGLARKLGLDETHVEDESLLTDWMQLLQETRTDFTLSFRSLVGELETSPKHAAGPEYTLPAAFTNWLARWQRRSGLEDCSPEDFAARLLKRNPVFIPRNHLVEEAINEAERGDFAAFHRLVDITGSPFDYRPEHDRAAIPPKEDQVVHQTFCGT